MNKVFFIVIVSLLTFSKTNAQKGSNDFNIHAAAEIPIGDFASAYNTGWGVHLTDYISLSDAGGFLLNTGFISWKDKLGANIKAGLLLIRGGYRQFVSKGFYFQGGSRDSIYFTGLGKRLPFQFWRRNRVPFQNKRKRCD